MTIIGLTNKVHFVIDLVYKWFLPKSENILIKSGCLFRSCLVSIKYLTVNVTNIFKFLWTVRSMQYSYKKWSPRHLSFILILRSMPHQDIVKCIALFVLYWTVWQFYWDFMWFYCNASTKKKWLLLHKSAVLVDNLIVFDKYKYLLCW